MIIANYIGKIKQLSQKAIYFLSQKDTLISLILLATGAAAFTLGYFAGKDSSQSAPKVVFTESNNKPDVLAASALALKDSKQINASSLQAKARSTIFGSKSGTKYYYSWCKSGNRVKLENRVYFESVEQAEKAGRSLAANCK